MACGKLIMASSFLSITPAKITLISENTILSHSPPAHGNQAEQFHYHYVAERKTRSLTKMPSPRQLGVQMGQWQY